MSESLAIWLVFSVGLFLGTTIASAVWIVLTTSKLVDLTIELRRLREVEDE